MIKPTVGRVVLFHPNGLDAATHPIVNSQPHAALIAYVHSDTLINVSAFDANGVQYGVTNVRLLQDSETASDRGPAYAEFMAFQKGQAAAADTKGGIMDRMLIVEAAVADRQQAKS